MTENNTSTGGQGAEKNSCANEEQLRQSEKMEAISQLAACMAHDFNNVLATIMMQAELSAKAANMSTEAQAGFEKIRSAAEHAAFLTRQLLLFSRKQAMQPRDLNLNDVVTHIAKTVRRIVGENVRLRLNLHPAPMMVHADDGMIEQILLNLVMNAHEAMPRGGSLAIETAEGDVDEKFASNCRDATPGHYVYFSVSDTGTGIAPAVLPKIFEPLFTTKEKGKGMGLGLSTVSDVVKQHGGFIKVNSEPGQGTKFTIFLPAIEAVAKSAAPLPVVESMPTSRTGTETILLVEDDMELRSLAQSALEQGGYTVLEAANGLDALGLWGKHQSTIGLLLTDLAMPGGILGHELAVHLRNEYPALKIVFISGYSPDFAGAKSELRPGENFLQKPFSADQLLGIVRRSLDS
jgi:two-component system cell cycle sensor histidine kinase/response regulator CckA